MGNEVSSSRHSRHSHSNDNDTVTTAPSVITNNKDGEEPSPAALLIDALCGQSATLIHNVWNKGTDFAGGAMGASSRDRHYFRRDNSEDFSDDDDGTYDSGHRPRSSRNSKSSRKSTSKAKISRSGSPRVSQSNSVLTDEMESKDEDASFSDFQESQDNSPTNMTNNKGGKSNGDSNSKNNMLHKQPLPSAFSKRCYFTKAGIGKNTQHYEGLTISGNNILMLASAMKLKGCPTICDEDLRRVEQSYPHQFSRLPDELLLSSGWRRVSKYCHFTGKPIPDGVPFFHSKDRLHPQTGGYYFLLASSIGMIHPHDIEPLTKDTLILLQTDYPNECDMAPPHLIEDPSQWILVEKFCFFSGGPINTEEDVYYEATYEGNQMYMLAFLSPSLTPEELYRLNDITGENALKSVAAVEEVESVYDLTERDFEDLKLYHLGPCRALPDYILTPTAWKRVLPRHFIECREKALARGYEYEVHAQQAIAAAGIRNVRKPTQPNDNEYVEFNGRQPSNHRGFATSQNPDQYYHRIDNSKVEEYNTPQRYHTPHSQYDAMYSYPAEDPEDSLKKNESFEELPQVLGQPIISTPPVTPSRLGSKPPSPAKSTISVPDPNTSSTNTFPSSPKRFDSPQAYHASKQLNSPARSTTSSNNSDALPLPRTRLANRSPSPSSRYVPEKKITPPKGTKNNQTESENRANAAKTTVPLKSSTTTVNEDDKSYHTETSKSSAMRSAQELLKQNRQKRLEVMAKRRKKPMKDDSDYESNTENTTPHASPSPLMQRKQQVVPKSPASKLSTSSKNTPLSPSGVAITDNEDMISDARSGASVSSSGWTENSSAVGEKPSRRAQILEMAKNRMKGKTPPSKSSLSPSTIAEASGMLD